MIGIRTDRFSVRLPEGRSFIETPALSFSLSAGKSVGIEDNSGAGRLVLYALSNILHRVFPGATTSGLLEVSPSNPAISVVGENPWAQTTGLKRTALQELILPMELRGDCAAISILLGEFYSKVFDLHNISGANLNWLSGGELQRLHIASATALRPDILLLDHVGEELDPEFKPAFWAFLKSYCRTQNCIAISLLAPGTYQSSDFDQIIEFETVDNSAVPRGNSIRREHSVEKDHSALSVRRLSFRYSPTSAWLLNGISFDAKPGQLIFLSGSNGSGKTTIARIVNGLVPKQSEYVGDICLGNISLRELPESPQHRLSNIAFQNPDPYFCCTTVEEEIALGLSPSAEETARKLAEKLELLSYIADNPFDLPRGVRKRLSILLASQNLPSVLFLDEPTQYQNTRGLAAVLSTIEYLLSRNVAIICISHDTRLFEQYPTEYESRVILERRAPSKRSSLNRLQFVSPRNEREIYEYLYHRWEYLQDKWPASLIHIVKNWNSYVYPELECAISIAASRPITSLIDFGCGVGWQTLYTSWLIEKKLHQLTTILGLDFQKKALEYARHLYKNSKKFSFKLIDLVTEDFSEDMETVGRFDLATAYFLLHDLPTYETAIKSMAQSLRLGGQAIIVMLSPLWIEENFEREDLKRFTEWRPLGNCYFEWAGTFPVRNYIDELIEVPYFHRPLDDYLDAFKKNGLPITGIIMTKSDGTIWQLGTERAHIQRTREVQTITLIGQKIGTTIF